jgi:glycosyltransferase involved in cell wall biosynthesis
MDKIVKVLLIHNFYKHIGGEDLVFTEEAQLLESRGHEVLRYTAHNDQVDSISRITLARHTVWNGLASDELRQLIRHERPQLVHVHNTLPLLSPSVYHAARAEGLPVVQTLHNYRQMCPGSLCFRGGRICTDCVGRVVPLPAVRHACYRGSRTASAAVATMLSVHRLLGTWQKQIGVYIAPTFMTRDLFIQAGLPAQKLVVKPNFVDPDPGQGTGCGGYALFIGRLSVEKGVQTLLEAWRSVGQQVPLHIVGDGPMAPVVAAATDSVPGVRWLGRRNREEIFALLRDATCLIFPSEWYETFGRVIVEAFATATPVIAAGHGAAAELVRDGATGHHFRPGDPSDLAAKVVLLNSDPAMQARMRSAARRDFETRYTADVNYRSLMTIYHSAISGTPSAKAVSDPGTTISSSGSP